MTAPERGATVNALAAVLDEIEDFLEDHQDVVDGSDGPRPNRAMSLLTELAEARTLWARSCLASETRATSQGCERHLDTGKAVCFRPGCTFNKDGSCKNGEQHINLSAPSAIADTPQHPSGGTFDQWLSHQPFLSQDFGSFRTDPAKYYTADTVRAAWVVGSQCVRPTVERKETP